MEYKDGRCKGCIYARTMGSNGGWQFIGCTHKPYNGKWVTEIKDCPKEIIVLKEMECRECGFNTTDDNLINNSKTDQTGNHFCPECGSMAIVTEHD